MQRGNALFIILIAVALFAALSYAITQSSRGSGNINTEQAQLDAAVAEQCAAYVQRGVDVLETLGNCPLGEISYELPDGTNENPDNPSNTACFLFDPAGAGLTACGIYATASSCSDAELAALSVGEKCAHGDIVYAGISGGHRIYTTLADIGILPWDKGPPAVDIVTGVTSASDGLANTNTLVALSNGASPYTAAVACRGLGPDWYLPAYDELELLYNVRNTGALNGTFNTSAGGDSRYWASNEYCDYGADGIRFDEGIYDGYNKDEPFNVRCVRR